MKCSIFLLPFLLTIVNGVFAQSEFAFLGSLTESDCIECSFVTELALSSKLTHEADSLLSSLSDAELIALLEHSLPVVKHYAFFHVLIRGVDLGSDLLSLVFSDTTSVCFICGRSVEQIGLNKLLAKVYEEYLWMRYRIGGVVVSDGRIYNFGLPDKRLWVKEMENLRSFSSAGSF